MKLALSCAFLLVTMSCTAQPFVYNTVMVEDKDSITEYKELGLIDLSTTPASVGQDHYWYDSMAHHYVKLDVAQIAHISTHRLRLTREITGFTIIRDGKRYAYIRKP